MHRRVFLQGAASAAGFSAAVAASARGANSAPNDRICVCVMGVRGRGGSLLSTFASLPDVDVAYVCDVDAGVLDSRAAQLAKKTGRQAKKIKDYRRALDDKTVDALVNGAPDHWHALPTIHACQAGKDVYVEKPDAHNILEGHTMAAAARKYGRVVQLGTQGRSGHLQRNAMKHIAAGNLGKARFAKAWESSRQEAIGHPPDSDPPPGVDYDMWLGPAPKRPFNIRRFHSSWRWFFDYGTGDLGNDGVHLLDFARWGLETAVAAQGETIPALPRTVSAHGGKYYFDDDQQWPDTMMVVFDYPGYVLTYELRIWTPYPLHGESEGAAVYGDNGYVVLSHRRWRAFDRKGEQLCEETGQFNDAGHAQNFIDCMRTRKRPVADLETVGHPSSLLCHLGNAAWRAGRALHFDPEKCAFIGDEAANQYLTRPEYRKPWVLPAISEL
jgi:predicted dehydrogenase